MRNIIVDASRLLISPCFTHNLILSNTPTFASTTEPIGEGVDSGGNNNSQVVQLRNDGEDYINDTPSRTCASVTILLIPVRVW